MRRTPATRRSNLDSLSETPRLAKSFHRGASSGPPRAHLTRWPPRAATAEGEAECPGTSPSRPRRGRARPRRPPPYAAPLAHPLPAPRRPAPGQFLGAAHKPGAIPLRPLALGDIYDAAFKIIRFNPKATVGSAVLVTAVAMAIPVLLTAILTFGLDLSLDPEATDYTATESGRPDRVLRLARCSGIFLQRIGLVLVTGMIAHVVAAAAIGQRLVARRGVGARPGASAGG